MPGSISLTKRQLDQLATISESQQPNESVALLLGKQGAVTRIEPMQNVDSSKVSFSVNPSELIRCYDTAENEGLEILAIFHSHPGEPNPSPKDLAYMELNPVVWIIYSNTCKEFRAHLLDGGLRSVGIDIT